MRRPLSAALNIIWLLFGGIWLALGYLLVAGVWVAAAHAVTAIPMFLSVIGMPLGIANLKMIPISLVPLGKEIVDVDAVGVRWP